MRGRVRCVSVQCKGMLSVSVQCEGELSDCSVQGRGVRECSVRGRGVSMRVLSVKARCVSEMFSARARFIRESVQCEGEMCQ